jgi:hypothetical protein
VWGHRHLRERVKGLSALQLARDLCCQYKSAFVLAHKLREALAVETVGQTLDGEVEVDGAHFGGVIQPENRKEGRKDRRFKEEPVRPSPGRGGPP